MFLWYAHGADTTAAGHIPHKRLTPAELNADDGATVFDMTVKGHVYGCSLVHIDTDESNAACAFGEIYGEIVK